MNVKAKIAIGCAAAAVVVGAAGLAVAGFGGAFQDAGPQQQAADEAAEKGAEGDSEAASPGAASGPMGYTGAEAAVNDILKSNVWRAGEWKAEFYEGSVRVAGPGESAEHALFIRSAESAAADGLETWTCEAMVDGEATTLEIERRRGEDSFGSWALACPAIGDGREFSTSPPAAGFSVSCDYRALSDACGGDGGAEAFESALSAWCRSCAPTATGAEWNGEASRDYGQNATVFSVTLNDRDNTVVNVLCDLTGPYFQFQKA